MSILFIAVDFVDGIALVLMARRVDRGFRTVPMFDIEWRFVDDRFFTNRLVGIIDGNRSTMENVT